jgi:hypothetical protein
MVSHAGGAWLAVLALVSSAKVASLLHHCCTASAMLGRTYLQVRLGYQGKAGHRAFRRLRTTLEEEGYIQEVVGTVGADTKKPVVCIKCAHALSQTAHLQPVSDCYGVFGRALVWPSAAHMQRHAQHFPAASIPIHALPAGCSRSQMQLVMQPLQLQMRRLQMTMTRRTLATLCWLQSAPSTARSLTPSCKQVHVDSAFNAVPRCSSSS